MQITTFSLLRSFLAISIALLTAGSGLAAESEKKPLKIVFMMGQSNMVGYSRPGTAWYLTQPAYMPPAELGSYKPRFFTWNHYWSGVNYALGSEEYIAKGQELIEERSASRKLWRSRIFGNFSRAAVEAGKKDEWNYKEWGDPPHVRKIHNREFLDIKAEEEGIYQRIEEYIESPENKFHPKDAIAEIANRDGYVAEDLTRVKEIFLKGTKPEDFDGLAEALKDFGKVTESNRVAYAELVREKINLPIAERTRITAIGEVSDGEANGILSLGYAKWADACGPEYPFGISFEQMVDGPVLIVKCAVGGTSLQGPWRPTSLGDTETPIEKAAREVDGEEKNVKVGPLWTEAINHIKTVLADPGKFHPDYDPKAGVELAGLVWFQGWNDLGNDAYGEQFVHFIKDFRKEVNAPELPVISGLMGHGAWKQNTFSTEPNQGMLYAAQHPELKGTVDLVNTLPYMPIELSLTWDAEKVFGKESKEGEKARSIRERAVCKDGTHYFGNAKFVYQTGDAMARKLVNLMKGGEPSIHKEAQEILGKN
jgi:hypothetical protein